MSKYKSLETTIKETIAEATPAQVGSLAVEIDALQAKLTKLEAKLTKAAWGVKHPKRDDLRKTKSLVDKLNKSVSDFTESSNELLNILDGESK